MEFQEGGGYLPEEFQESLRSFIDAQGAHVCTLNYDDLLYDCFTDTIIFREYKLRDGFFREGRFDFDRAEALYSMANREGWFLHLHGSPLFVNKQGHPTKITRADLRGFQGTESTHLVLTNVRYKQSAISSSEILSRYWDKLSSLLTEVSNIVLLGYGGGDMHLNNKIALRADRNATIRVVERRSDRLADERKEHWERIIPGREIEIVQEDTILDFRDWNVQQRA